MEVVTPRVNFELMQGYIGRKCLLVGKVERVENGQMVLRTSDNAQVSVTLKPSTNPETPFVEVMGTVVDPNTMAEEEFTNCGESVDLNLYNEMVKLAHGRHRSLFL